MHVDISIDRDRHVNMNTDMNMNMSINANSNIIQGEIQAKSENIVSYSKMNKSIHTYTQISLDLCRDI